MTTKEFIKSLQNYGVPAEHAVQWLATMKLDLYEVLDTVPAEELPLVRERIKFVNDTATAMKLKPLVDRAIHNK